MMSTTLSFLLLLLAAAFLPPTAPAQTPVPVRTACVPGSPAGQPGWRGVSGRQSLESADEGHPLTPVVLTNLIAAETAFREALGQFSFKRDVVLQTIGPSGDVTGEYIRRSVFVLDDSGRRIERVLYHPASTIREMAITKEDVADLAGSQLFGLELSDFTAYDFSRLGEETLAGRAVYSVAVSPKHEPDPQHMRTRFFVGRIWIDAETFQTVKLEGITEPHGKQRFPTFQTRRELKIEQLLFPSRTTADDVLHFRKKDVHYRIDVKYYDFKRFASRVKIVEID